MASFLSKRVPQRLYSRAELRGMVFSVVCSVLISIGDFVGVALVLPIVQVLGSPEDPGPIVGAVQRFTGVQDVHTIVFWLIVAVVVSIVGKNTLGLFFRWWMHGFSARLTTKYGSDMFRRILRLPYPVFRSRSVGEYLRVVEEGIQRSYVYFTSSVITIVSEASTILAASIALLVIAPLPGFLAVAYFALSGTLLLAILRPRQRRAAQEVIDIRVPLARYFLMGIQGFREVRLTGKTDEVTGEYRRALGISTGAVRVINYLGELPKHVMEIIFILGVVLIAIVTFAFMPPSAAAGALATLVVAGSRVLPSIVRLQASVGVMRGSIPAVQLVLHEREWLESLPESPTESTERRFAPGTIEVRDVSYRYPESEELVLRDIALTVGPGRSVALTGASGAGKSTLLDILMAMQEPTGGTVTVDGRSIFDDVPAWHASIGVVPQDVYLTDATLAENIAFGDAKDEIDPERLREAIAHAELESVVAELPEGLQTQLGERGVRLSGGQRQRVGIARALYRRPAVLVLDEATSALDNETEHRFTRTVERLRGDLTLVVVAHRLSTVRNCDEVIYLEEGRIVARGTFDEVRRRNEHFARLVDLGRLVED